MADQAKRRAQVALYAAIQNQAETNMKAALPAATKAGLLRDLAEAYRLAAGGSMPSGTGTQQGPPEGSGGSGGAAESPDRGES